MAKEVMTHKIIINYNKDGTYRDGVIMYRVKTDGVWGRQYHTIAIEGAGHSVPQFKGIINKFKKHAEKAESITESLSENIEEIK